MKRPCVRQTGRERIGRTKYQRGVRPDKDRIWTVGVSRWRDGGPHACLREVGSKKEEGKAENAHFLFSRWRDLESVEMPSGQRQSGGGGWGFLLRQLLSKREAIRFRRPRSGGWLGCRGPHPPLGERGNGVAGADAFDGVGRRRALLSHSLTPLRMVPVAGQQLPRQATSEPSWPSSRRPPGRPPALFRAQGL